MSVEKKLPLHSQLAIGMTSASLAEACTLPLDTIKVHMQANLANLTVKDASSRPMISTIKGIYQTRGIGGFYQSWFPSIARTACATGSRLGSYEFMKDHVGLDQKIIGGNIIQAGVCGLASNTLAMPLDVIKTRIQSRLATGDKLGFLPMYKEVWKEAGIKGFYSGFSQNIQRSILLSCVQLPTYFYLQDELKKFDHLSLSLRTTIASIGTTFAVTSVVYPIDLCKTLVQNDFKNKLGTGRLMINVARENGISKLYQGSSVMLARAMPQFMLVAFFYEHIKTIFE